jgi:inosose dehydratase
MTRRSFLTSASAAALSLSPLSRALHRPGFPWRFGIQSYSLRGYKLDQALSATTQLGLEWWEGWEGHVPMTENLADRSEMRLKLRQAGVRVRTFGVVGFNADAARSRRIFDFARAMGVETLSADPTPESFATLETLTQEYKIRIAIHNHGPGSRYDKIESVASAVRNRNPLIGACVDTGHFLRSKEDPVKAIEAMPGRVFGVHLKDVAEATKFRILGKGDLDSVGVLRALKRQNFDGIMALEYEENPQDPMADLKECVAHVEAAMRRA